MEETLVCNCINQEISLAPVSRLGAEPQSTSKEYQRNYYLNNLEKFKEKRQQYQAQNGGYFKAYYEANKEQMKQQNKEHYSAKQEHYKEKRKLYYQTHKTEIQEKAKIKKILKSNTSSTTINSHEDTLDRVSV